MHETILYGSPAHDLSRFLTLSHAFSRFLTVSMYLLRSLRTFLGLYVPFKVERSRLLTISHAFSPLVPSVFEVMPTMGCALNKQASNRWVQLMVRSPKASILNPSSRHKLKKTSKNRYIEDLKKYSTFWGPPRYFLRSRTSKCTVLFEVLHWYILRSCLRI